MPKCLKRLSHSVFSGFMLLFACSPQGESSLQEKEKTVPVNIMTVTSTDLPIVVESVGRVIPNRQVVLSSEVGGVIESFQVDVGDRVTMGQVLAKIDPTDYQLSLAEAKANLIVSQSQLKIAERSFQRSKNLLPEKVITHESFENDEAERDSARASLDRARVLVDIAKEKLQKTVIKAPFKGLIAERMIEKGQTISMGQSMLTLVDLNPMRVKVFLTESDYMHLDPEDPVSVEIEASPGLFFQGKIDRIGIKADDRTNSFDVEILVDNPDLKLKAGMTARVKLTMDIIRNTILIPQSAILYRQDKNEVFIADLEQMAQARTIQLGRTEKSMVQILSGLNPGDHLIITGGQYLKSGDALTISSSDQADVK